MANAFKKGEVVVMKSGGPPMTINKGPGETKGYREGEFDEYHCEWFKGATHNQGSFPEHLLEKYVPPKK